MLEAINVAGLGAFGILCVAILLLVSGIVRILRSWTKSVEVMNDRFADAQDRSAAAQEKSAAQMQLFREALTAISQTGQLNNELLRTTAEGSVRTIQLLEARNEQLQDQPRQMVEMIAEAITPVFEQIARLTTEVSHLSGGSEQRLEAAIQRVVTALNQELSGFKAELIGVQISRSSDTMTPAAEIVTVLKSDSEEE
jgi:uncharacterized membrane protein YccC